MKRSLILLLSTAISIFSFAQGLDYTIGTGTTTNLSGEQPTPIGDYYMGSRAQILYRASELQAAGMGPGFIYSVKWDIVAFPSVATVYDWKMRIGTTTATVLSSTSWEATPGTLVFDAGTNNPYNPGAGLKTYPLTTPFYWNGIDNILIETCHGNSGRALNTWTENASLRKTATGFVAFHYYQVDNSGAQCTSNSTTGTYNDRPNIIFNWGPAGYNNAGVAKITQPTGKFCPGTYQVKAQIKNQGQNQINGVKVYWELDGVLQPVVNFTGTLDIIGGPGSYTADVVLGTAIFAGPDRSIKVYTSMPNNVVDTVNMDDTLKVKLGASPKAYITPGGPTVFCTAGAINVTLTAPAGAGNFYQWLRDNQPIAGATNAAYTATIAGDYTVRIDSNGCTNTSAVTRVDNLAMPLPIVHPSGYPVLCSGDSLVLTANAGITGASYQWQFQGADILGATNASYAVKSPGNYTVITSKYVCNSSSPGINVVPAQQPTPFIEEEANGTLKTDPTYVSYQWQLDGNDIPGATFFAYKPLKAGNYTVIVSNGGCSATSDAKLVNTVSINNIYTAGNNIRIYPNPVSSILYVDAPANVDILISSMEGKLMLKQQNIDGKINLNAIPAGIYVIKILDREGGHLKTDKLIKAN